jgi:hypothetical protein
MFRTQQKSRGKNIRTVILAKNNMLGLFSLATVTAGTRLVTLDPRQARPAVREYRQPVAAMAVFNDRLQASVRNGWTIMYDGPPLHG